MGPSFRAYLVAFATLWLAVVPALAGADAPVEEFVEPGASPTMPSMVRGTTRSLEVFGQLAVQEGVVLGKTARAPLGLRPLVGVSFLEFGDSRIMLGLTLAFPFSLEMGWGTDLPQFAVTPGIVVSSRPCADWSWFAGVEVPIVVTPERRAGLPTEVLSGLGLRGGAAWYFLAGLGIFAEANLDIYIGQEKDAALGIGGGVVLSWERFRYVPASDTWNPGGGS